VSLVIKMNKRGDLTIEQVVKLILAGAGVAVLVLLFWALFSTSFDEEGEIAKTSLKGFKNAIDEVNDAGFSRFALWGGESKMVYFGDRRRIVEHNGNVFFRASVGINVLCFCYIPKGSSSKEWKCESCEDFDKPMIFTFGGVPLGGEMIFEEGNAFDITEGADEYILEVESK
jgi:hypothetical protein